MDRPQHPVRPDTASSRRGLGRMLLVAVMGFAFAFALVPLYRIACEKFLGIRMEQGPMDVVAASQSGVDETRWVTVQFDGGVNSALPWEFRPHQASMKVHPGKQYETSYYAKNTSNRVIVGSAVPSVAPAQGSRYFNKTECFCFTAQTLAPGESRDMPVRFIVDPALPKDIKTLTLSYAFFRNDSLTAEANQVARLN
ncbi:cytochrome c oxidase assembly protein [Lysobacteraceae bacterium NML07-0707]|nr:cytochrome c oxidase assembly protein [Xanthomonadaceae bacterium NML07-0707]